MPTSPLGSPCHGLRRWMRSDISLLRAARLVNCACRGDSLSKSPLSRLNEALRRYVEKGKIPRDQPMISHRRQVIHDSLYGARDIEAGRPVKGDTTFRISSISNLVTGAADQVAPLEVGIFGSSFDTGTEDIDNALDAANAHPGRHRRLSSRRSPHPKRVSKDTAA